VSKDDVHNLAYTLYEKRKVRICMYVYGPFYAVAFYTIGRYKNPPKDTHRCVSPRPPYVRAADPKKVSHVFFEVKNKNKSIIVTILFSGVLKFVF